MKLYIILFTLLFPLLLCGQEKAKPLSLRASQSAIIYVDSIGQYISHTEWSVVNSTIMVLDGANNKFTVYAARQSNFKINDVYFTGEDSLGYWLKLNCMDDRNYPCRIRVVALRDLTHKVYIDYNNFTKVYKASEIE